MARNAKVPAVSSDQARYILEKLIDERKVSAADVRRHLGNMWAEMNFLEKRLSELRGLAEPLKHPMRAVRSARAKLKQRVRSGRQPVSAEVASSRVLQGKYIAAIRQVPKAKRARFARIAKEKGREEAIKQIQAAPGK